LKFWQRRNSRFLGASRFFARQKTPQSRFIAVHEFLPQVLPYLGNPQTLLDVPPEQVLKDSRSSRVVRRMLAGKPVIVKLFKTRSRWGRIKNLLRSSPARRSWLLGCQLLDRGLATARPLAYFQSAKNGIPGDGIVLTEEIPEALDLAAALRDPTLAEFAPLWRDRLARLIRLLHERGVSHRDLKAPNILLPCPRSAPALAEPILVDLVGVRVARHVPRRTRVRDLARLNLSASVLPILRQTDRLRFLLTYLNRQTRRDRSWKAWWREIAQATQVKQLQNQHRGRPIA
jgi:hypothetical protein